MTTRCRGCNGERAISFCPHCGERTVSRDNYRLRYLLLEFLEALTSLDSRLWRTLQALFLQPGELSAAWWEGRRGRYLKVFQLLVLASVVYFLFTRLAGAGGTVFDIPLSGHVAWQALWHQRLAEHWVNDWLASHGGDLAPLAARFDQQSGRLAQSLVFLIAPLFMFMLALLVRPARYLAEHAVFAAHFTSLALLLSLPLVPVVFSLSWLAQQAGMALPADALAAPLLGIYLGWWFWRGTARYYGASPRKALAWTLALVPLGYVALQAYRALLFVLTWWMIT